MPLLRSYIVFYEIDSYKDVAPTERNQNPLFPDRLLDNLDLERNIYGTSRMGQSPD